MKTLNNHGDHESVQIRRSLEKIEVSNYFIEHLEVSLLIAQEKEELFVRADELLVVVGAFKPFFLADVVFMVIVVQQAGQGYFS